MRPLLHLAVFIILLASSCLSTGCSRIPDYTSPNGVSYFYEADVTPWETSQIDAQEAGFLAAIEVHPGYENSRAALAGVSVTVYGAKYHCNTSATGWCDGDEDFANLSVVRLDCPGNSALTHEMLHWLDWTLRGVTDYDHTGPLWSIADAVQPGGCQ